MTHHRIRIERTVADDKIGIELAVHPCYNGNIIVNYPGITGTIDGYENKYGKMADFIQGKRIGTVVRMGNEFFDNLPYPDGMIDNFRFVLDYCLKKGKGLSGTKNPTLYLMGFSAGASTVATVASDYPAVKKILLMAPSGDAGQNAIKGGLERFEGEVYIAVGANDEVVGPEAGQTFYELSASAKLRKLEVIPECDHQFRGEKNGKIMSKAPLWAFLGDDSFPSPDGGKKLY